MRIPDQLFRFTVREMQAVGFVVEGGKDSWPSFADVFLHIHPNPGRGLEYFYFPLATGERERYLPRWAHDAIEQGALHATLVGGPGGMPLTDLRIECKQTRYDADRSGERAFFLSAYTAVRKAIHLATAEAPRFMELDAAIRFRTPREAEDALSQWIEADGGTILSVKPVIRTNMLQVRARIPAERVTDTQAHITRSLPRIDTRFEAVPDGYRSRDGIQARGLLQRFGAPLDWPRSAGRGNAAGDVPQLGDPFPDLPFKLGAPD